MSKVVQLKEKLNKKPEATKAKVILENLKFMELYSHPRYPNFPYVTGKGRITQIANSEKLQLEVCKIVGGDFFVEKDPKWGNSTLYKASNDNGETFKDAYPNFKPTKTTDKIKSSPNRTYQARIDLKNRIFAVDSWATKQGLYINTRYFKYLEE